VSQGRGRGGNGLFKEGYLKPFKELDIKNSFLKTMHNPTG